MHWKLSRFLMAAFMVFALANWASVGGSDVGDVVHSFAIDPDDSKPSLVLLSTKIDSVKGRILEVELGSDAGVLPGSHLFVNNAYVEAELIELTRHYCKWKLVKPFSELSDSVVTVVPPLPCHCEKNGVGEKQER